MATSADRIIRLHVNDNVAVAKTELPAGVPAGIDEVVALQNIPAGHKIALRPISRGAPVYKYNQVIGFAGADIDEGEHVHVHNVEMRPFDRQYDIGADVRPTACVPQDRRARFDGFRRPDGRVGTRNYVGVLTSVNCSATVARYIADSIERSGVLAEYPAIDGIVALSHGTGCGIQAGGEAHVLLQRVLEGYARHPNFGGVLMIGLGCEVNQLGDFFDTAGLTQTPLLQMMTIQEEGGTRKTVQEGVRRIRDMLPLVGAAKRESAAASELTLALQCGGSDAYSGLAANPALGAAADLLIRHGGTAILSETPEIYGAEHLLIARAETPDVAERLLARLRWWEDYTARTGGEMNNNPSPGNKAGGLTTILEKALGAAAKGGTTNLVEVYDYAEPVRKKGFVFMDSPGYDPASVTGQVAAGANMICFTTGRGSVFGFKPAPSLKIATNTDLYRRMPDDMDINAGEIIDGVATIEEVGEVIFHRILEVASGKKSLSEELGFGDNEFVPWQIGAMM